MCNAGIISKYKNNNIYYKSVKHIYGSDNIIWYIHHKENKEIDEAGDIEELASKCDFVLIEPDMISNTQLLQHAVKNIKNLFITNPFSIAREDLLWIAEFQSEAGSNVGLDLSETISLSNQILKTIKEPKIIQLNSFFEKKIDYKEIVRQISLFTLMSDVPDIKPFVHFIHGEGSNIECLDVYLHGMDQLLLKFMFLTGKKTLFQFASTDGKTYNSETITPKTNIKESVIFQIQSLVNQKPVVTIKKMIKTRRVLDMINSEAEKLGLNWSIA